MGSNEPLRDAWFISGGTVVNADSSSKANVAVANGRIKAVGKLRYSDYQEFQIIDAQGKFILPGAIDPHVHFSLPTPAGPSSDDFLTGSKAALSGGTTSFIDFVTPKRGQSLLEALKLRKREAASSLCEFKLHMGISEWNQKVKAEVRQCIEQEGITSFKAYLAYRDSIGISVPELRQLMEVVAPLKGTVLVHCEDGDRIQQLQDQFLKEGKKAPWVHPLSRPPDTEIDSIRTVIELCSQTGCQVYIVHVSTGEGADLIRGAKDKGYPVLAETCIQYLIHDDEVYDRYEPPYEVLPFVISPPIRSSYHQQKLWQHLKRGTFDTVATDHCPFNLYGQKDIGIKNFTRIPNGAGGVEYRPGLLYTYGVLSNFITMEQFVSLTSTRPAELFGWGNRKGKIRKDYDADLVIYDPAISWVISAAYQVQNCDSNIFEGIPVNGKVIKVLAQGKQKEIGE